MRKERIYAIEACREVCNAISDKGFVVSRNGLSAVRYIDKDIKQEVNFQITSHWDIITHFNVSSRKVKKWLKEKYNITMTTIPELGEQLGYITPRKSWLSWYIGESSIAKTQFLTESVNLINEYLIPYFDQFYDVPHLIDKLCCSGGKISPYINSYWTPPISFVLCYGGIEKSQELFDTYILLNPAARKNIMTYKLQTNTGVGYVSAFSGNQELSIAFDNGIVMK